MPENPIYIIGANPLAYYLGVCLQSSGEDVVIILENKNHANTLEDDGVSIKEDRNLSQKKYKLKTAYLMKNPAKMVVIATDANRINTALSNVSRRLIGDAPVICFTPLKDFDYLFPILGGNLYPAYFNGYLSGNEQNISVHGRSSSMTLCNPDESSIEILKKTGIEPVISHNPLESFWEYFAPYALCSILSAAENKKVSDMLKDKNLKERFRPLIDEFSLLAASDGIDLDDRVILRGMYNTPSNYMYPLHRAILNHEKTDFDIIGTIINKAVNKSGIHIPETNALLKKLYNKVLI